MNRDDGFNDDMDDFNSFHRDDGNSDKAPDKPDDPWDIHSSVWGGIGEEADPEREIRSFSSETAHAATTGSGHTGKKTGKKKRVTVGRILLSILLIFVITGSLVVGAFSVYVFGFVDDNIGYDLNNLQLQYTSIVYAKNTSTGDYEEVDQIHGTENRRWLDYESFSPYLCDAIVSIEDKRFYSHDGVDWKRTFSAFVNMFFNVYGEVQGGSTITQQLVKNLTGDDQQTSMRKIQEIMRARKLEKNYPKSTILECYVNTVHFGNGCDGIEVAARYYFNKEAKDLTLLECASLAATIQTPASKNPIDGPEANKERREICLHEMLDQGYITQAEYDQAMADTLVLSTEHVHYDTGSATESSTKINSYFVDAMMEDIIADLMSQKDYTYAEAEQVVLTGGLQIYSTMNPDIQSKMEEVFKDDQYFTKVGKSEVQPQAAMTMMDYSGHIVGIVGGRGEKTENRSLNRATQSKRQPGSCIKPLAAYSPSIEFDLATYSTLIQNSPLKLSDGTYYPKNASSGGKVTVAKGLESSLNCVAVRLVNELSPQKSFDFLTGRYHLSTLISSKQADDGSIQSDINLAAMGLGGLTQGVTVTEMCAAYATFGNLGVYWSPSTYTVIYDTFGNVVLEQEPNGTQAISEETANIMNEMMQRVVAGSDGTATSAAIGDWPIYGKTGTTDQNYDRWFIGGTPYYIGAAWYGFDTPSSMGSTANPAAKFWRPIMKAAVDRLELCDFRESDRVEYRYYCTSTGLVATTGCSSTALGFFKSSYLPPCTDGGKLRSAVTKPSPAGGKFVSNDVNYMPTESEVKQNTSSATASKHQSTSSEEVEPESSSSPPETSIAESSSSPPDTSSETSSGGESKESSAGGSSVVSSKETDSSEATSHEAA